MIKRDTIRPSAFSFLYMRFLLNRYLFSLFFFFSLTFIAPAQENDSLSEPLSDAVNTEAKAPPTFSQKDFSEIDAYVLHLKKRYKKIPDLAKDLSAGCSSDEEKVRAIFMWLTNNIAYDVVEYHSKKGSNVKFTYKTAEELEEKRKIYYYNYATKVLRNKKGICEGYAVLFQELCRANNIPCEIAVGRASNNINKIERIRGKRNFSTNHAWNRVKIGDEWFYADATWASGYCDPGAKKFYKNFQPYYYLTPLNKLYQTHAENEKQTEKRNNVVAKVK
jgi:transglutaminase/protease-like cytokinesis protein 3